MSYGLLSEHVWDQSSVIAQRLTGLIQGYITRRSLHNESAQRFCFVQIDNILHEQSVNIHEICNIILTF